MNRIKNNPTSGIYNQTGRIDKVNPVNQDNDISAGLTFILLIGFMSFIAIVTLCVILG